jgi:glycosyltransferase involved in cell wall biosynthesis
MKSHAVDPEMGDPGGRLQLDELYFLETKTYNVRCPTLQELPPASAGQTGWPWTEDSTQLPLTTIEGNSWPRITVVTPSFNQGQFIEETIRSILLQGYPNLEYFVLDGGSKDNTVEIIKKYSRWCTFWASEPDGGQSSAINRGLKMGSGVYATWINSDDMLCKDALANHCARNVFAEDVIYIGDCIHFGDAPDVPFSHRGRVLSLEDLVRVKTVWRSGGHIDQPAVLFPLDLALRVGGVNAANYYTMDYELWGQFLLAGARVHYTGIPFGLFRWHDGQKTQDNVVKQTESMLDAATSLLNSANSLSAETKQDVMAELQTYRETYPKELWKKSGRLAKIGLPPSIVEPMRKFKVSVEDTIRKGLKAVGESE